MNLKFISIVLGLSVPFFILTVWAISDVLRKSFGSTGKKALWAIIASIPFIGAIIYLLIGFRQGKKSI